MLFSKYTEKQLKEKGLIKTNELCKCYVCKGPAHYVEICSEQVFCSEECLNKFYDWYYLWIKSLEVQNES